MVRCRQAGGSSSGAYVAGTFPGNVSGLCPRRTAPAGTPVCLCVCVSTRIDRHLCFFLCVCVFTGGREKQGLGLRKRKIRMGRFAVLDGAIYVQVGGGRQRGRRLLVGGQYCLDGVLRAAIGCGPVLLLLLVRRDPKQLGLLLESASLLDLRLSDSRQLRLDLVRLLRDLVERVRVWPVAGDVELAVRIDPDVVHDRDRGHEIERELR